MSQFEVKLKVNKDNEVQFSSRLNGEHNFITVTSLDEVIKHLLNEAPKMSILDVQELIKMEIVKRALATEAKSLHKGRKASLLLEGDSFEVREDDDLGRVLTAEDAKIGLDALAAYYKNDFIAGFHKAYNANLGLRS